MAQHITALLGAGFSKWSCDLPLVANLFDFNVYSDSKAEEKRFIRLKKKYDIWRKNNPNGNNESFIAETQTDGDGFNLVNWYVTRRLVEPFIKAGGRRHTWYINSYHPNQDSGIQKARKFLYRITQNSNSSIITTNYDMIVEYALSSKGFHYGVFEEQIGYSPYPYPKPVYLTGRTPLIKLHGSVSWDAGGKYPDQRAGLTGKCIIVPPMSAKSPRTQLPKQWEFAEKILKKTSHLVVFGFAFNEYDHDIWKLLTHCLSQMQEMTLIDINDLRPKLEPHFPQAKLNFVDVLDSKAMNLLYQKLTVQRSLF